MRLELKGDIGNLFEISVRRQLEHLKGFYYSRGITIRNFNDLYDYLIKISDLTSTRMIERFNSSALIKVIIEKHSLSH